MKEMVSFIAKSLVSKPEEVKVTETDGPEAIILTLSVAEEDMGKVIGKRGRIAKSMRTLVKAASMKAPKPIFVEIR